MSPVAPLSRRSIARILLDLVAAELARTRSRSVAALGRAGWTEATRLDGPDIDADSLDRLNLAGALNEFFHLHEHGTEDYLLTLPRIGDWCDLVEAALRSTGTHLTFRTSGSTGVPRRCTHRVADLHREAAGWADRFPGIATILTAVPGHHIYGTIFTALLPDRIGPGCAVAAAEARAVRHAGPGTLVVATPAQWRYLAATVPAFPENLAGVTSASPMPAALARQLREQGLARLVQVYGSSETAGIAAREHEDEPYALLDGWSREGDVLARPLADGSRQSIAAPDQLAWTGERTFLVDGRRDGAVQVGGHNVFPARVRDLLLTHPGITEAVVRLDPDAGRLKAFVVPAAPVYDPDGFTTELDRWCGERLRTAERPRGFTLGVEAPVTAMGKAADW